METNGFILVKHKGKRSKRTFKEYKKNIICKLAHDTDEVNFDPVIKQIAIKDKDFCDKIVQVIKTEGIGEVVCYGIGRIGNCKLAQHQFGTLVTVISQAGDLTCHVSDPVLSDAERTYIKQQHINILSFNDLCSRRVHCPTLFFMIHCSKRMYDNVLKSNWDQLHKCTIIGNSFSSYRTHCPDKTLEKQVPHIFHSIPHTTETLLPEYTSYPNVYNNTVILQFAGSVLGEDIFQTTFEVDTSEDENQIIINDAVQ